jgi:hypothetical protein
MASQHEAFWILGNERAAISMSNLPMARQGAHRTVAAVVHDSIDKDELLTRRCLVPDGTI